MRTRADVFAIVTITLLFVAQTLAFNLRGLTGGAQGLAMPIPPFPAATFERPFYYVLVGAARVRHGLTCFVRCAASSASRSCPIRGRRGQGPRRRRARTGVKVLAFSVSVGIVAMVGGVWAYYESFIYPQFAVDPLITIAIVLMTFLGGRATLWGPVHRRVRPRAGQQYLAYQPGREPVLPDRVRAGVPPRSCCCCRAASCPRPRTACAGAGGRARPDEDARR